MQVLSDIAGLKTAVRAWRRAGKSIAFVPTMGYLHRGHVTLLEEARKRGDVLVLSIFVNPTQFGPKEDLSRYPRDLDGDLEKARGAGTDLVFTPTPEEMYPAGYQTYVEVKSLEQGLCGEFRPGHFVGVASVVCKLFNLVEPDVAVFGQKDYQQLQVISQMVRDLNMPIEIVGIPIVRESDGLAMSSRNAYLSPTERKQALALSRALSLTETAFKQGERDPARLVTLARTMLERADGVELQYLELRDGVSLVPSTGRLDRPTVLAVAAFVGKTRLIDNVVLQ